jgi:hypothetical protein
MTSSRKNDTRTAPSRKAGKAARVPKPARSRAAKSSSSGKTQASRKAASSTKATTMGSETASRNAGGSPKTASSGKPARLSAGALDPLVLDYLKKHKATAPHGPSQVAKALGRSSGAVGNCLVRLTGAKKAKQVSDKPLRYDLAG